MKRWLWGTPVVLAVLYLGILAHQIRVQGLLDEARPADVIVVLGAAEYRGRPSPVLRARLDHALDLYRRNLAPRILTTGGAGGDPIFTEGGVGRSYLSQNGVPAEAIIVETLGDSTAYSTTAAAEILKRMNLQSCIVVSDGYHVFRAKKLLEAHGLVVYGSPRPLMPHEEREPWWAYWRQAFGFALWSVGIKI